MPIDRDATFTRTETLLRQGKPDGAIEEYVRLVDDQLRDWNSSNSLGDAGSCRDSRGHIERLMRTESWSRTP